MSPVKISGTAVLIAIVSLIALAIAAVIGITAGSGPNDNSTPALVTVFGFIGTALPALLALLKSEATRSELHNGLIPSKVHEAIKDGLIDGSLQTKEDRTGVKTRVTDPVKRQPAGRHHAPIIVEIKREETS